MRRIVVVHRPRDLTRAQDIVRSLERDFSGPVTAHVADDGAEPAGLDDAACLVLLWSKHAAVPSVTGMLRLARDTKRPIIAVSLDEAPLPLGYAFASALKWQPDEARFAAELASAVGQHTPPKSQPPARSKSPAWVGAARELLENAIDAAAGVLARRRAQHSAAAPMSAAPPEAPPPAPPALLPVEPIPPVSASPPQSAPQPAPVPPSGPAPGENTSAMQSPISDAPIAPAPAPARESVRFRCAARRNVAPGQEFTARFVAYPPSAEARIDALLRGVDAAAEARPEHSEVCWALDTLATVTCRGDQLSVDPPTQTFVWRGEAIPLDFDIRVAPDAALDRNIRLKFDVAVDGVVVARLRADLHVVRTESSDASEQHVSTRAARTAFASYASIDRARVLDRVASVRTATGLDVWLDCISLRPNEHWREELGPAIAERDLFLLFWSRHAASSTWVEWEWRSALAQKGLDAMQLHPLENLAESLPAELRELHATDALMDVREAELTRRSEATD